MFVELDRVRHCAADPAHKCQEGSPPHGLSKIHGGVSEKATRVNGRGQPRPVKTARPRTTVRPRPRGTHFPKYRGRRREAGATSPSAIALPRRGTEVFRFLIFTVRGAGDT